MSRGFKIYGSALVGILGCGLVGFGIEVSSGSLIGLAIGMIIFGFASSFGNAIDD